LVLLEEKNIKEGLNMQNLLYWKDLKKSEKENNLKVYKVDGDIDLNQKYDSQFLQDKTEYVFDVHA